MNRKFKNSKKKMKYYFKLFFFVQIYIKKDYQNKEKLKLN